MNCHSEPPCALCGFPHTEGCREGLMADPNTGEPIGCLNLHAVMQGRLEAGEGVKNGPGVRASIFWAAKCTAVFFLA